MTPLNARVKTATLTVCWVLAGVTGLGHASAMAQSMYKCQRDGTTYYADRPCSASGSGAVSVPGESARVADAVKGKANDLGKYLYGRCANLYYQLRHDRALDYKGREAAYNVYRDTCTDEDGQARWRMQEALSAEQYAQFEAQEAQEAKRREAERKAYQCKEMNRIYKNKLTQVTHMSSGELNDFTRFKESFTQRCLVGSTN